MKLLLLSLGGRFVLFLRNNSLAYMMMYDEVFEKNEV